MLPTEEELRALRESVLFPFILSIFDIDKKAIQSANVKFQKPYLELIERAEKDAHACMVTNKKYLRSHGIKVYQEERSTVDLKIKYACRGFKIRQYICWTISRGRQSCVLSFIYVRLL